MTSGYSTHSWTAHATSNQQRKSPWITETHVDKTNTISLHNKYFVFQSPLLLLSVIYFVCLYTETWSFVEFSTKVKSDLEVTEKSNMLNRIHKLMTTVTPIHVDIFLLHSSTHQCWLHPVHTIPDLFLCSLTMIRIYSGCFPLCNRSRCNKQTECMMKLCFQLLCMTTHLQAKKEWIDAIYTFLSLI